MAVHASPGASGSLARTFWVERWIWLNEGHHASSNGSFPALFECETKKNSWFHPTAISWLDAFPSKFGLREAILAEIMVPRMIIHHSNWIISSPVFLMSMLARIGARFVILIPPKTPNLIAANKSHPKSPPPEMLQRFWISKIRHLQWPLERRCFSNRFWPISQLYKAYSDSRFG